VASARPRRRNLSGRRQYRIIPSRIPPIELFETLVAPDELAIAYAIESLTNDRLRAAAGDLYRVPKEDWVTGPNASVVMAAFTHIGRPSRFTDGSFGVYYAALDTDTAIAETVFHAERFLRETAEPPIELERRCYVGKVLQPLDDLRGPRFTHPPAEPRSRHLPDGPGLRGRTPLGGFLGAQLSERPPRGRRVHRRLPHPRDITPRPGPPLPLPLEWRTHRPRAHRERGTRARLITTSRTEKGLLDRRRPGPQLIRLLLGET